MVNSRPDSGVRLSRSYSSDSNLQDNCNNKRGDKGGAGGPTLPPKLKKQKYQKVRLLDDPFDWSQLPADEEGAELSKEARIWKVYVGETDKWDAETADGWNKSLDVLLVFAALFSAISTAFLIESSSALKQDPNDVSAAALVSISQALLAITNSPAANKTIATSDQSSIVNEGFVPSQSAVIVNTLWFLSLALSISASFLAMLAKDWCHSFTADRRGHHRDQAYKRQRRWTMIKQWKMRGLILVLPSLIQMSLLLFDIGLCIYLWDLNITAAIPVICISGAAFAFYSLSSIAACLIPYFPYTTTLSGLICSKFVQDHSRAVASFVFDRAVPLGVVWLLRWIITGLTIMVEGLLLPLVVWDIFFRKSSRFKTWKEALAFPQEIGLKHSLCFKKRLFDPWKRFCSAIIRMLRYIRTNVQEHFELSDEDVTSLALSWLLEYCETPNSVAISLQAIAGATQRISTEPLIKHGASWQILRQLVSSTSGSTAEWGDLYYRAFNFLQKDIKPSYNNEMQNDLDIRVTQVMIWDLKDHQDKQIGDYLKKHRFSPTKANLKAMNQGNEAILLSLQLLKRDKQDPTHPNHPTDIFKSIIGILEDHITEADKKQDDPEDKKQDNPEDKELNQISLYSLMNATALLASVSQVSEIPTDLLRLSIETFLRLKQPQPLANARNPTVVDTIMCGTKISLVLCALFCLPYPFNQSWSSLQANARANSVVCALVAKDPERLEYQRVLCRAGCLEIWSHVAEHGINGDHGSATRVATQGQRVAGEFLQDLFLNSAAEYRDSFEQHLGSSFKAIVDMYEIVRLSNTETQTPARLHGPVHPLFLASACSAQLAEQQKFCDRFLPESAFPTRNLCFQLTVSLSEGCPPLLVLYEKYQNQDLDLYWRHLSAVLLWFFVFYYQRWSLQDQHMLVKHWRSSEQDRFQELVTDDTRRKLETFIMIGYTQGKDQNLYFSRVIECILQSRRPLEEHEHRFMKIIEDDLEDVPPHLRGLSALSHNQRFSLITLEPSQEDPESLAAAPSPPLSPVQPSAPPEAPVQNTNEGAPRAAEELCGNAEHVIITVHTHEETTSHSPDDPGALTLGGQLGDTQTSVDGNSVFTNSLTHTSRQV